MLGPPSGDNMLVVHIITSLGTGGAEHMLKRLVDRDESDPGEAVHHVISIHTLASVGPELQRNGVAVEAIGLKKWYRLISAFRNLRRRLRALGPDVVQTWMYHGDFIGGLAAYSLGIRNVVWNVRTTNLIAGMGVPRRTMLLRHLCARLSRRIPAKIVYVAHAARHMHEMIGYDPSKSVVIPNGYSALSVAPFDRGEAKLRRELCLEGNHLLIGTAGRFVEGKNYPGFLRACARTAAERPDAQFVLIGPGLNRDNAELVQWVRTTGYADRFHLLGERSDFAEVLAALDIFCLTSVEEGFPNVVAEAMHVGIPCLVTDVGDSARLVGDTGVVVPPRDQAALDEAMLRLVRLGHDERVQLGLRARAHIMENYSITTIRNRYEQLYRSLAGAESMCDAAAARVAAQPSGMVPAPAGRDG